MLPAKLIYSPYYQVELEHHVYLTEKYALVRERLLSRHWAEEGDFLEPGMPPLELLLRVHSPELLADLHALRLTERTWRAELPVNADTIRAAFYTVSGTVLAVDEALREGVGIHLGGGHHHAFPGHAEGFCFLNDVALGAVHALDRGVARVAVIDCDLHQGNGTAVIFQREPRVFTFSIHEEDIYPPKEHSSLDVGLAAGTGDEEYLRSLEAAMEQVWVFDPGLIIYVGGTDPYYRDKLGLLELSKEGLYHRDEMILEGCFQRRLPVVTTLSGGYAQDPEETIELHTQTVILAIERLRRWNDR